MSLLKTNEIQVFSGTTVTITAMTAEVSGDLNVGADLDVTGTLTLGTALAIAEGGTGATDAATARTNLDVDQAGTDNSTDVTLVTTSHDYLSIAGQAITLGPIDLAADVTGTLATSSGGTGVTSLGSLDAADLGSGAATDGYVLTADGAGGAAWEAKSPIDLLSSGASIRKSDGTTAVLSESGGEVNLTNVNLTSSVGNLPSNRNLIINGDFRVNQRGAASRTATSNAYNYDRWYYDGTYLYQGVEDKSVANGTYTLTWVDAGSDITAAYVVSTDSSNNNGPDSGLTYTSVSNGGNITVSEGTEYSKHLWIRFGGTLANLSKVQLVYGSVATPFEHRPYGIELALCQRYYQIVPFTGTAVNTGEMGVAGFYKVDMRTTPSFNSTLRSNANYTGTDNRIVSIGVGDVSVGSATAGYISTGAFLNIYCTGLVSGSVYIGSTVVSAEL